MLDQKFGFNFSNSGSHDDRESLHISAIDHLGGSPKPTPSIDDIRHMLEGMQSQMPDREALDAKIRLLRARLREGGIDPDFTDRERRDPENIQRD